MNYLFHGGYSRSTHLIGQFHISIMIQIYPLICTSVHAKLNGSIWSNFIIQIVLSPATSQFPHISGTIMWKREPFSWLVPTIFLIKFVEISGPPIIRSLKNCFLVHKALIMHQLWALIINLVHKNQHYL